MGLAWSGESNQSMQGVDGYFRVSIFFFVLIYFVALKAGGNKWKVVGKEEREGRWGGEEEESAC